MICKFGRVNSLRIKMDKPRESIWRTTRFFANGSRAVSVHRGKKATGIFFPADVLAPPGWICLVWSVGWNRWNEVFVYRRLMAAMKNKTIKTWLRRRKGNYHVFVPHIVQFI